MTASAASGRVGLDTSLDTAAAADIIDVLENHLIAVGSHWAVACEQFGISVGDTLPGVLEYYNRIVQGHGLGNLGVESYSRMNDFAALYQASFGPIVRDKFAAVANFLLDINEPSDLESQVYEWFLEACGGTVSFWEDILGLAPPKFEIRYGRTAGYGRIYDAANDLWIVDTSGRYACCEALNDTPDFDYVWVPYSEALMDLHSGKMTLVSEYHLETSASNVQVYGYPCVINKVINTEGDGLEYQWIQAMVDGQMNVLAHEVNGEAVIYVNRPESDQLEQDSDRDYDDSEFDSDNYFLIDPSGNFIPFPGLNYDASTKTYNTTYNTFNESFNTYITNNYSWTYHINYTSITYIGQTEEYNKYYELYYNLPDGRSSADLTREELEQLNVSVDVIPYGRSADDTSLRSLYHFDGDTKESSYWNYCTEFTWNKGASLTYMDSGVFEGALYLDETEHDFTITLPNRITSGEFTLQFRFYQSATAAPQADSYISFGDTTVFQFTGAQFLNGSGTALSATPVGTWNEIALIRYGSTLYYYLNGIKIGSVKTTDSYDEDITFHFGADQQTYKYFDELRFLNYALCASGASYTPTAVPYDTNLALVLPGDEYTPVADEYWKITSSGTNLFTYDLTTGKIPKFYVSTYQTNDSNKIYSFPVSNVCAFPQWGYPQDACEVFAYDGCVGIHSNNTTKTASVAFSSISDSKYKVWRYGALATTLWCSADSTLTTDGGKYSAGDNDKNLANGNYVLTVVLEDGRVGSHPFTVKYGDPSTDYTQFTWGQLGTSCIDVKGDGTIYKYMLYIKPNVNNTLSIRHIEVVSGTSTDLKVEKIESVTAMDNTAINTPSLAVRTDIDITGYQIGGVRPSLPKKGQVWALVEGGYITSIQIYTGSAWENVDGRIWTGSRWVPASSYNIITLQDMYDIVDATPGYEYIYTEFGFWDWFQKSWNTFTDKLFSVLQGGAGCQHEYVSVIEKEATCTDSGRERLTCSLCGAAHTEEILALGHDWMAESTETTYELPADTCCPDCSGLDYTVELDKVSGTYSCTCASCSNSWTVQAIITEGNTLYTCSRCGETTTELPEEESDLFEAIGNFIANGITWVTDKLKQLVDGLSSINEVFDDYTKKIQEKPGDYPAFLTATIALMPEDLMDVFWFGVIAAVVLAVWKKWFR